MFLPVHPVALPVHLLSLHVSPMCFHVLRMSPGPGRGSLSRSPARSEPSWPPCGPAVEPRHAGRPKSRAAALDVSEVEPCGCSECNEEEFRVYVQKHPWHTGFRALLCRLFPRYGNYCGPNFSSGRDGGSSVWDLQPVDCLDYCCYKHDMGYDSRDQYELLLSDLKFLNCLRIILEDQETEMSPVARAYASFCVLGLQAILIPYRKYFLKSSRREYLQRRKSVEENQQQQLLQPPPQQPPFESGVLSTKKEIPE